MGMRNMAKRKAGEKWVPIMLIVCTDGRLSHEFCVEAV